MISAEQSTRNIIVGITSFLGSAFFFLYLISLPDEGGSSIYITEGGALALCGLYLTIWFFYTGFFSYIGNLIFRLTDPLAIILGLPINGFAILIYLQDELGLVRFIEYDLGRVVAGLVLLVGIWWWDLIVARIWDNELLRFGPPGILCGIAYLPFAISITRIFYSYL